MKANVPKGLGSPANMNQLMQQAQKMQEKLEEVNAKLDETVHEISGGGGLVTLKINGKYEVSDLSIDSSAVDPDDIELLCDLITETVNKANVHVTEYGEQEREKLGVNL